MYYRIFRMHAYTGVGHTTASQHKLFDSEKLTQVFLVLLTGFDPLTRALDLQSNALTTEPTRHPGNPFNPDVLITCHTRLFFGSAPTA